MTKAAARSGRTSTRSASASWATPARAARAGAVTEAPARTRSSRSLPARSGMRRAGWITSLRGITRVRWDDSIASILEMLERIHLARRVGTSTPMFSTTPCCSSIPLAKLHRFAVSTRGATACPSTKTQLMRFGRTARTSLRARKYTCATKTAHRGSKLALSPTRGRMVSSLLRAKQSLRTWRVVPINRMARSLSLPVRRFWWAAEVMRSIQEARLSSSSDSGPPLEESFTVVGRKPILRPMLRLQLVAAES